MSCPNCGYCRHCGRGNWWGYPSPRWQWQPWVQPSWGIYSSNAQNQLEAVSNQQAGLGSIQNQQECSHAGPEED